MARAAPARTAEVQRLEALRRVRQRRGDRAVEIDDFQRRVGRRFEIDELAALRDCRGIDAW